jgi:hypothetical protein
MAALDSKAITKECNRLTKIIFNNECIPILDHMIEVYRLGREYPAGSKSITADKQDVIDLFNFWANREEVYHLIDEIIDTVCKMRDSEFKIECLGDIMRFLNVNKAVFHKFRYKNDPRNLVEVAKGCLYGLDENWINFIHIRELYKHGSPANIAYYPSETVDNSSTKKTSWIPKSIARMFGGGEGYTLSDYIFFAVIILLILLCIWATIGRTVITPFIKDHMIKSGLCRACQS